MAEGNGPDDLQLLDFVPAALEWATGSDQGTIHYEGAFGHSRSRSRLGQACNSVDAKQDVIPAPLTPEGGSHVDDDDFEDRFDLLRPLQELLHIQAATLFLTVVTTMQQFNCDRNSRHCNHS